jgi:hypothetical protein
MSGRHRRSKDEQRAAALRVIREGPQPVGALAEFLGISSEALTRWIVEGRATPGGHVFLDGLHRPYGWDSSGQYGWMSSEEAVKRFLEQVPVVVK